MRATGGAVAAAAATLAGCSGSNAKPPQSPELSPATSTTAGQSPVRTAPSVPAIGTAPNASNPRRGGTLRYTGLVTGDGKFDPHKTQSEAFQGHQSLVYSRLLAYRDQAKGELLPDLARTMPEQPDSLTFIFEVNGSAAWQPSAPFNGRPVTAEDVKISIERQLSDASFAHRARLSKISKIEAIDNARVKVTLSEPYAPLLNLFADASGYIVPAELANGSVVPSASLQPGSGPFRWVEWSEQQLASVARNPSWYGGNDRPYLDGVAAQFASDATEIEAHLRIKELDVAVVGRPAADRLLKAIPGLVEQATGHAQWFGMRFYLPIAPYDDNRLRTAISIAIDRREILEKLFAGSGELNPWVSWPVSRWSLPQAELIAVPGHRVRQVERENDIAEARRLRDASISDRPLSGQLELIVPEDIEASLGLGTLIKNQIKQNINLNVGVNPVPIEQIVQRLYVEGTAPWVIGQDTGWLDLDDWVYPHFHTNGPTNSFPLRDSEMDALIIKQRQSLDEAERREAGYQIQRKMLYLNAGVNLVSERVISLSWPYVKDFPVDVGNGYQHRFADTWLDRNDPSFRGR